MSKGIISEIWGNPRTKKWYGRIKSVDFPSCPKFIIREGEERKFTVGAAVEFEAALDKFNVGEFFANKVRLADSGRSTPRPARDTSRPARDVSNSARTAFFMPKDTSELIFGSSGFKIENIGLRTQKYIARAPVGGDKEIQKINSQCEYSMKEKRLQKSLISFQQQILANYKGSHYCVTGTLGSRMAIGLGGSSVYETTITLHHTYTVPYISGSTFKGCLRGYIIRDVFGGKEDKALENNDFTKVFGDQEKSGRVVFLDALPLSCDKLEIDIMNPHFSEYYQGTTAPTDDLDPTPILFYTVPAGTKFVFRICSRKIEIR